MRSKERTHEQKADRIANARRIGYRAWRDGVSFRKAEFAMIEEDVIGDALAQPGVIHSIAERALHLNGWAKEADGTWIKPWLAMPPVPDGAQ